MGSVLSGLLSSAVGESDAKTTQQVSAAKQNESVCPLLGYFLREVPKDHKKGEQTSLLLHVT